MSRENLLSVIIPAWNIEKYVADAIKSVPKTVCGVDTEIIVSDDGSEDNTASVAESLGVTVIRGEHKGTATARNSGLTVAKGKYLLFLDADDVLTEGALEKLLTALMENKADYVSALANDFISPELTEEEKSSLSPRSAPYPGMLTGCVLFERDFLDTLGLFNEHVPAGETVDFLSRMQDGNGKAIALNEVVLNRRLHMTNSGRVSKKTQMESYAEIIRQRIAKAKKV